MDKLDMLFIRACKAKDPRKRLNSLYYRFFLVQNRTGNEPHILHKLAAICDRYDLIGVKELIYKLSPDSWMYVNSENGDIRFDVLLSIVRLSNVAKFPDFISPAVFRNR